jgi:hypothetical protein
LIQTLFFFFYRKEGLLINILIFTNEVVVLARKRDQ